MISVEKPGSPAEVLEHHGTKGMKWGVRKARAAASESHRTSKQFEQKFPTSKARSREIHRARGAVERQKKRIDKEKDPANQKKLAKAFLNNPDRATAMRITRGEKVTTALLAYVFTGPTLVVPAAVGGYTASRAIRRKRLEKKMKL